MELNGEDDGKRLQTFCGSSKSLSWSKTEVGMGPGLGSCPQRSGSWKDPPPPPIRPTWDQDRKAPIDSKNHKILKSETRS